MRAKYIRVSTDGQNTARQVTIDKDITMYTDKISGSVPFNRRPAGIKLLKAIGEGKIKEVEVHSIDRLGRNQLDVLKTIEYLTARSVNLFVKNIGTYSLVEGKKNPAFQIIVSVLSSMAESEKEQIKERQAEGIRIARNKGKYKGREVGTTDSKEKTLTKHKDIVALIGKDLSIRKIAEITKKSTATVQKVLNLV